jgi:hypothetical protein
MMRSSLPDLARITRSGDGVDPGEPCRRPCRDLRLLAGLLFGDRIARRGASAPIYTVGLTTFLIVLGLGLSPLPQDSSSIFISRVFDVMVAAIYAIGMASLLRSAFRAR